MTSSAGCVVTAADRSQCLLDHAHRDPEAGEAAVVPMGRRFGRLARARRRGPSAVRLRTRRALISRVIFFSSIARFRPPSPCASLMSMIRSRKPGSRPCVLSRQFSIASLIETANDEQRVDLGPALRRLLVRRRRVDHVLRGQVRVGLFVLCEAAQIEREGRPGRQRRVEEVDREVRGDAAVGEDDAHQPRLLAGSAIAKPPERDRRDQDREAETHPGGHDNRELAATWEEVQASDRPPPQRGRPRIAGPSPGFAPPCAPPPRAGKSGAHSLGSNRRPPPSSAVSRYRSRPIGSRIGRPFVRFVVITCRVELPLAGRPGKSLQPLPSPFKLLGVSSPVSGGRPP